MNESQGNFGNISPDAMSAIRDALNRRGMGDKVPAFNQQSGASPTASPLPANPQTSPVSMPQGMPQEPQGITASPAVGNDEAKLIVGALKERLKAISTVETSGLV